MDQRTSDKNDARGAAAGKGSDHMAQPHCSFRKNMVRSIRRGPAGSGLERKTPENDTRPGKQPRHASRSGNGVLDWPATSQYANVRTLRPKIPLSNQCNLLPNLPHCRYSCLGPKTKTTRGSASATRTTAIDSNLPNRAHPARAQQILDLDWGRT